MKCSVRLCGVAAISFSFLAETAAAECIALDPGTRLEIECDGEIDSPFESDVNSQQITVLETAVINTQSPSFEVDEEQTRIRISGEVNARGALVRSSASNLSVRIDAGTFFQNKVNVIGSGVVANNKNETALEVHTQLKVSGTALNVGSGEQARFLNYGQVFAGNALKAGKNSYVINGTPLIGAQIISRRTAIEMGANAFIRNDGTIQTLLDGFNTIEITGRPEIPGRSLEIDNRSGSRMFAHGEDGITILLR